MTATAVLSAVFGGYDSPRPTKVRAATMITDRPVDAPGWHVRNVGADPALTPVLRAKLPKMMPSLYVHAEHIIWIDGSADLDPNAPDALVDAAGDAPVAMFRHPFRDDIYEEADASVGKYLNDDPHARIDQYRAHHPEHWGLWSTGVIVWRRTLEARELGQAWYLECLRGSVQDQVSLPVVCREAGIRPAELPGDIWHNPYVQWHAHAC